MIRLRDNGFKFLLMGQAANILKASLYLFEKARLS